MIIDGLHRRARAHPALQRLAVISRILLAFGFIPSGLVKVLGRRFTTAVPPSLDLADPIGLFFESMYRTGAYWQFLGWVQVIAGVCLLVPRTTTLGAVLFLPVLVNIVVVTVALDFTGTPAVVALMLLANVFLLAWDYDRIKGVVWPPRPSSAAPPAAGRQGLAGTLASWDVLERWGYVLGTIAGLGAFLWTRTLVPHGVLLPCLGLGVAAGGMVLVAWWRTFRRPGARG